VTSTLTAESAAIALCAEGAVLSDTGDADGAIDCYRRAVDFAPAMLSLHLILANAQQLSGRTLAARDTLRAALRLADRPYAAADFTLGKALVAAGAGADAVPCFRRVRAEFPDDAAASAALAAALRDAHRPHDAWREIQVALRMAPHDPVALLTAAQIRHDLSDFVGALQWCDKSLSARPESDSARVTRGYLRHLLGDAAGGWRDFEARPLPRPDTAAQMWRGEPLHGLSLLVIGEQGVGDQFQFLRFVRHPALQAAARVVVACQPDSVSLLRACGYDAIARDQVVVTDRYVPMLSLPLLLGSAGEDVANGSHDDIPYIALSAAPARKASHIPRVGIVWAGNPAHRNDAARSIPSKLLHALFRAHPNVRFVCLQHGSAATELSDGSCEHSDTGDWLATARVLHTLDLLISVDTGVAHLAGAMHVPVWMMVPHVPDWRWGVRGSSTPWYPSMRLFRQPSRGDWVRVLTNVSAALRTLV
jgi:tetratricopeptide (TPR) repeat protein